MINDLKSINHDYDLKLTQVTNQLLKGIAQKDLFTLEKFCGKSLFCNASRDFS